MAKHGQIDLEALLSELSDAGVDFVVVGGVAGILHGAPLATQDLDIVHRQAPQNISRLFDLLTRLDAKIRDPAGRLLRLDKDDLHGAGQLKLSTLLGPLDLLCQLHDGRTFEDLLPHSVEMTDGTLRLMVVDLDTLIEIKSGTGRARDKLALSMLLALRKEKDWSDQRR